jgi:hypothetical protein
MCPDAFTGEQWLGSRALDVSWISSSQVRGRVYSRSRHFIAVEGAEKGAEIRTTNVLAGRQSQRGVYPKRFLSSTAD